MKNLLTTLKKIKSNDVIFENINNSLYVVECNIYATSKYFVCENWKLPTFLISKNMIVSTIQSLKYDFLMNGIFKNGDLKKVTIETNINTFKIAVSDVYNDLAFNLASPIEQFCLNQTENNNNWLAEKINNQILLSDSYDYKEYMQLYYNCSSKIVTTNGYELDYSFKDLKFCESQQTIYIHKTILEQFQSFINTFENIEVLIFADWILFETKNDKMYLKPQLVNYPNLEKVLDATRFDNFTTIDCCELKRYLNMALIYSDRNKEASINIDNNVLTIKAKNKDYNNEFDAQIVVENHNKAYFDFKINPNFVLNAISKFKKVDISVINNKVYFRNSIQSKKNMYDFKIVTTNN